MASSTSNSKRWRTTWLTATVLLLAALASYEGWLKEGGHRPSVAMNPDLWSWHRAGATQGSNPVVLLGASRMLLNISMPAMRTHYAPRNVFMLALNGRYPLAALEQLAQDSEFVGTVIVSLNAQALEPVSWQMQGDYAEHYSAVQSPYHPFDAWLASLVQSKLRFANTELSLLQLITYFDQERVFRPPSHTSRAGDLSIRGDFSKLDHAIWQRHFYKIKQDDFAQNAPTPFGAWATYVAQLRVLVETIQERGGQVVLLRMPTSHDLWQIEERHYPRAIYWDFLAENAGAKALHFDDIPVMRTLYLPDASHIDYRDRETFTSALLAALGNSK